MLGHQLPEVSELTCTQIREIARDFELKTFQKAVDRIAGLGQHGCPAQLKRGVCILQTLREVLQERSVIRMRSCMLCQAREIAKVAPGVKPHMTCWVPGQLQSGFLEFVPQARGSPLVVRGGVLLALAVKCSLIGKGNDHIVDADQVTRRIQRRGIQFQPLNWIV